MGILAKCIGFIGPAPRRVLSTMQQLCQEPVHIDQVLAALWRKCALHYAASGAD
jgi:hypothetical protein